MNLNARKRGFLLTLEGGEGAGKSTQIKALTAWLRRQKLNVEITRQPGGSKLGQNIRRMVLNSATGSVSPRAELLLYEADRAQHVDEYLAPALAAGKIILSDRFADSSTVYQGICRGLGVAWTEALNGFATNKLQPDLTIVLDVPVETGRARIGARGRGLDRMEREKKAFHEKVRRGFLTLARRNPKRIKVIKGTLPPEEVTRQILSHLRPRLGRKGFKV